MLSLRSSHVSCPDCLPLGLFCTSRGREDKQIRPSQGPLPFHPTDASRKSSSSPIPGNVDEFRRHGQRSPPPPTIAFAKNGLASPLYDTCSAAATRRLR